MGPNHLLTNGEVIEQGVAVGMTADQAWELPSDIDLADESLVLSRSNLEMSLTIG